MGLDITGRDGVQRRPRLGRRWTRRWPMTAWVGKSLRERCGRQRDKRQERETWEMEKQKVGDIENILIKNYTILL